MPDNTLEDAIREAYALSPSNIIELHTLQITHPLVADDIFLVQDRNDWTLTLEGTGGAKVFKACSFRMTLPASGESGIQELNLAIDNVDKQVSNYIALVKDSSDPVTIYYRPYLNSDASMPQMNPPLVLTLRDIIISPIEVTGKASFADIINKPFPTEFYTRERFPSLGNLT